MADRVGKQPALRLEDGTARRRTEVLAAEEPLEVRVNGDIVTVIMRTPGDDFELALGFLLTEGIVGAAEEVETIRYCADLPGPYTGDFNVVQVTLRRSEPVAQALRRRVLTTSSCGLCGSASIDAVRKATPEVSADTLRMTAATLADLPGRLRANQRVFDRTGGLHAAGVFTAEGAAVCVREDVGRHNAVDKVIGWAATQRRLPLAGHVLLVSGRVAFEITQKALMAGIPLLAAVSAPSSLAVQLAQDAGMTLVGFLRGQTMNIYAHEERVVL